MSRFTQFYGYRSPYDEDQSRERYLAVLKSRQRVSALKETAEKELSQGISPPPKPDKTTSEILTDEAELQKQVLATLGSLLQRADGRRRSPTEPDDVYAQRTNPVLYVYRRLSPELQSLLITQIEGIKKDLGGSAGKILPEDFLTFLDAYATSYKQSGGVSSFNRTNVVLERLRGIQDDIAESSQVGDIKYILEKLKSEIRTNRQVESDDKSELARQIEYISRKLDLIKRATQVDLNAVGAEEIGGQEDVLNSYNERTGRISLNAESRSERIAQEIEKNIPTRQTMADITEMLRDYAEEGGTRGLGVESAFNVLDRIGGLVAPITEQSVSNIERISTGRPVVRTRDEPEFPSISMEERIEGYVPPTYVPMSVSERVDEIESRPRSLPTDKQFKNIIKAVRNEYRTRGVYSTNPTAEVRQQIEAEALRRYEALAEQTSMSRQPTLPEVFSRRPPPLIIEEDDEDGNPVDETTEGFGLQYGRFGKSKARVAKTKQVPRFMVGRGLALPKTQSKYVEFGKYAISIPQLQKGILTARYANSGNAIQTIPPLKVTPDFADFIESFIETEHLDEKRLGKLPADEKRLFAKLINGSGLYGKYKVKVTKSKEEDDEEKRFHLVKGMFVAGNDNPQVVKELKQLIIKFMSDGRIPRSQGQDLLLQLVL